MNVDEEKITSAGVEIWVKRPVKSASKQSSKVVRIDTANLQTSVPNMDDPWASPLRLIEGDGFVLDISQRRRSMPFWHRNLDFDELIFCFEGKVTWETDQGSFELKSGEMLIIPRAIAHRVVVNDQESEYVALEIKSKKIETKHSS